MRKITAIHGLCFDLYSTLVHESKDNPFYRDVATALDLDLNRWMPSYRRRHRETMAGLVPGMVERVILSVEDIGVRRSPEAVRAAIERSFPDFVASIRVDPQAETLLSELRTRGLSLALVTNASDHSEEIFDRLGLRKYFDVTVFSYRVRKLKPDPEIYRYAIDGLGLIATQCAFIGDGGDSELHGARSVGLTTILVDRRLTHSTAARADADAVVDDLVEISGVLDALNARLNPTEIKTRK